VVGCFLTTCRFSMILSHGALLGLYTSPKSGLATLSVTPDLWNISSINQFICFSRFSRTDSAKICSLYGLMISKLVGHGCGILWYLDVNEPSTFCSYSWYKNFLFLCQFKLIGEKQDLCELLFHRSPDRCWHGGHRIS